MHELSIARSILDLIDEQRATTPFDHVRVVRVAIGQLASVDARALEFGFDAVVRGTVADSATLVIVRRPGKGFCTDCAKTIDVATRADACPSCGGNHWLVTSGDDLRVVDLEVD